MTRRRILEIGATALACTTAVAITGSPAEGWITIAHLGMNLAGRNYTEDHLAVIARDVKPGMHVVEWYHDDTPTLEQLYGIVTDARRYGDEFQVKIRWFADRKPKERSWIGLHAMMNPAGKPDGTDGFELTEVLHLEPTCAGSNFQRATAI